MKVATIDFGTDNTHKALSTYDNLGAINFEAITRDSAICKMTKAYLEGKSKMQDSIMLAHSNIDVLKLNEHTRDILKQSGNLKNGVEIGITTRLGDNIPKEFAGNDRVVFLAKEESMGVENGTFGSVVYVDSKSMVVRLDGNDEKIVSFNHKKFNNFDHGYAATIHKAQGVTKDSAYFLATPGVDKNLTYVACSRHKHELGIYASTEDFANKQELFNKLSSSNLKSMAIDFAKANGIDIEKIISNDISLSDIKDRTLEKALECVAEAKRAIVKVYDSSKGLCGTVTDKVDLDKLGKFMEIKDKDGVCHLIDTKEFKLELEKGDKVDIDKGALGKDKDIVQDKAQELQKDFVQRIEPQISF